MSRVRATLAAFALLCATGAFAADDDKVIYPGTSRAEAPAQAATGSVNTITLVLGLALAGVGGWLVWRNRRGVPVGREARLLNVEETRSLGNRQYLVVASYEDRKFLIGVCPGRIDMLSPLTDDVAPAKPRA
ncbi:MAG: flagellar biosynthetic protein FliO [Opitutaceae bacterium]|nr:flagellar biosynthetic protein FliO [Opitutaceae bacterium]